MTETRTRILGPLLAVALAGCAAEREMQSLPSGADASTPFASAPPRADVVTIRDALSVTDLDTPAAAVDAGAACAVGASQGCDCDGAARGVSRCIAGQWGTCECVARECREGESRACSLGPDGTAGVGRCRAGVEHCNSAGLFDGLCVGATGPADEACANGVDDDCDGDVDEGCAPAESPATCPEANLGSVLGTAIYRGTTAGATLNLRGSCEPRNVPARTFSWRAPSAGTYSFTTVGSSFDTILFALNGGCAGAELGCSDDIVHGTNQASSLTLNLAANQTVVLGVTGYDGAAGSFVINASRASAGAPSCGIENFTVACGALWCPAHSRCVTSGGSTRCACDTGYQLTSCSGTLCSATAPCARPDYQCSPIGGGGGSAPPPSTADTVSGRFSFERFAPNAARTGWAAAGTVAGEGFRVLSMRGTTVVDEAITGPDGEFTVRISAPAQPTDSIVISAMRVRSRAVQFAVGNPNLATSAAQRPGVVPARPSVWAWQWPVTNLPASRLLTVTEAQGAGAAWTFHQVRRAFEIAAQRYPTATSHPLVVWLQPGLSWTCGACFNEVAITAFGARFEDQIWLAGSSTDRAWWSDSVTAHELGHWIMDNFGVSPNEGGQHFINSEVSQGLAWSEGWASWYGASARRTPLYLTRQQGVFWWLDYGARTYPGQTWWSATPAAGLLQPVAENEVTSVLWALEANPDAHAPLFAALASPRVTRGSFERGYRNSMGSRPVLPDFLDALNCDGFSRTRISAAVRRYPYPVNSPLCR